MIKLYVDDWCDNCTEFEADVEKTVAEESYGKSVNMTIIRCKHRKKCESIKNYIEDQNENLNEN